MKPILLDSSVWIHIYSKFPNPKVKKIVLQAKKQGRLITCGMVYLEVVRGCRDEKEFGEYHDEFYSLPWISVDDLHWELATKMGFQLSRKGYRPPATDLLIAALAIEKKCQLLHQDKHFDQIAEYFPLRVV